MTAASNARRVQSVHSFVFSLKSRHLALARHYTQCCCCSVFGVCQKESCQCWWFFSTHTLLFDVARADTQLQLQQLYEATSSTKSTRLPETFSLISRPAIYPPSFCSTTNWVWRRWWHRHHTIGCRRSRLLQTSFTTTMQTDEHSFTHSLIQHQHSSHREFRVKAAHKLPLPAKNCLSAAAAAVEAEGWNRKLELKLKLSKNWATFDDDKKPAAPKSTAETAAALRSKPALAVDDKILLLFLLLLLLATVSRVVYFIFTLCLHFCCCGKSLSDLLVAVHSCASVHLLSAHQSVARKRKKKKESCWQVLKFFIPPLLTVRCWW